MANWNLEASAGAPGTSLLWRGTWSSALSYNPNNGVLASNGCSYVSKTNNQNKNPISSPSDWDMIASIGNTGSPAFTITSADFVVPAIGASVVVTVQDASWITIGQMVVVQTAGGSPTNAYSFKVIAKSGNQVTLLNQGADWSGGDMLKSVYDVNADGIVDRAAVADNIGETLIYTYQDHFLTGSDGSYTNWTVAGTGATKGQGTSNVDHPGLYFLTTGTSNGTPTTGYAFATSGNAYLYGTGAIAFRCVILQPASKPINSAAAMGKFFVGMGTQPSNGTFPGSDFIGFSFDPQNGLPSQANNWAFLTRKTTVSTYTDTGYVYAPNVWLDLSFYVDATGAYFRAYQWAGIPQAKSAAITSNVPTGPLCPTFFVLNGVNATTSYQVFLDLWEVAYKGGTVTSVFRGSNLIRNF